MSMKVVSVPNGDYKVVVRKGSRNPSHPEYGGDIWLDVGTSDRAHRGTVHITGDLIVEGVQTTVQSETATIKDNTIILNAGESGNGVSLTTSGIEIDRGNYIDTAFLFNESVSHLSATGASVAGTFTFVNNNNALVGIQTCSINTRGQNLYLINAPGTGVVSVTGTTDYERNVFNYTQWDLVSPRPTPPTGALPVTDPDALVNVQGIADYITAYNYYYRYREILDGDTKVTCNDDSQGHSPSRIVFTVNNSERGQFNDNGLNVDNIRVLSDTISNTSANNLILTAPTSHTVELNAVMQLDDTGTSPTAVSGATKIYTASSNTTPGVGKTGIFFTNQGNSDELISKNRAVLLSILL